MPWPENIICDSPQLFTRRFSSTTQSSGVPIRIIGDPSKLSGVCPNACAIYSAVFLVASRDSVSIVIKTKLLILTASALRPLRFASSRTKLTFSL